MRFTLLAGAAAALAACHQNPGSRAPDPVRRNGSYDYVAHVAGGSFAGTFRVVEDTILVEASDGACWYDKSVNLPLTMQFKCEGVSDVQDFALVLDRRNPVRASRWSGTTIRTVQRTVCDRYETDAAGRRRCAASHTISEDVKVGVGGPLSVQAARPAPDATNADSIIWYGRRPGASGDGGHEALRGLRPLRATVLRRRT
jgi:hypothetical protein